MATPIDSGIHTQANDVRGRRAQGTVGAMVYNSPNDRSKTVINSSPQSLQVWTVTVDTATDDTAYQYEVNGSPVTFTSGTSTTKALIAAGLASAHNVNPLARGLGAAVGGDPDIVVTGLVWTIENFPL